MGMYIEAIINICGCEVVGKMLRSQETGDAGDDGKMRMVAASIFILPQSLRVVHHSITTPSTMHCLCATV